MKNRLLALIDDIDNIEGLFYWSGTIPGVSLPSIETIHNKQDFIIWIQELQLELQSIFDSTKDKFIEKTINDVSANFNGWNDRDMFNLIKGDLIAIKKNINKYFPLDISKENIMQKPPMIFISHATEDKDYVKEIVSLLESVGLNEDTLFCSSCPGYDIPLNKSIFEYLFDLFQKHDLHVVFIHSNNYYESPISLNEMGAAWILKSKYTSMLLPGFNFNQMTGIVNNKDISIKLDNAESEVKDKLNQLYKIILNDFSLKKKKDIIWEQKRDKFIKDINNIFAVANDII